MPIFSIHFLLCLTIAYLGRHKIMGFWGYFFASMLLTPVIGIILLLTAAPKKSYVAAEKK
ncbi:hypothetical protein ACQZV8_19875 [Magnetococcales bacterium HHB-1]